MENIDMFQRIRETGGVHDEIDARVVFGALKKLRDKEKIFTPALSEITTCASEGKWFEGKYADNIWSALENLEKYGFVKKLEEYSYCLAFN